MTENIDLIAMMPQVFTSLDGGALTMQFVELVSPNPPKTQPTGKHIRLSMTPADAMRLVAQLKAAQAKFGWPDTPQSEVHEIPIANRRNN